MSSLNRPTFVDLFSGCGGFGLGAELAGFRNIASVDIDSDLQYSYKLNFPKSKVCLADISKLDADFWTSMIGTDRPDLVIGGPPCQGFSRIGLRKPEDPRNSLIGHFFRQVLMLRPKLFVMENVEGILDTRNKFILDEAMELVSGCYNLIGPIKINALNCGAATSRKRVFVIGCHIDFDMPLIKDRLISPSILPITVAEAILDLPSPDTLPATVFSGYDWWTYDKNSKASKYARELQKTSPQIGAKFSVDMLKKSMISGVMRTKHTEAVITRFADTIPGTIEEVSRFPRLSWEGHCPTLRAGTGSDKGGFQAMRPIHPQSPRVITVREAARLQGFPDWFIFHPTIWHSFRMIGNSVSPIMSKYVLSLVREAFDLESVA
ncbi:Cytosine-specific methyltransferase [Pseudomonas syringae pv. syringae]|uniref:DNA cytosine methyltransferase n=1 Tax=Pseudomonas syringae TaxID=317 RepID=UPI000F41D713|nr:DNA cytosine methyltransferase [Pseudomonas syringae]RMU61678.1 Cytosine-specific methyltransferase [Pseudomonas syringae pv. syringae]